MEIEECEGTEQTEMLRQHSIRKPESGEKRERKKAWTWVEREKERNECEHGGTMEKEERYRRMLVVVMVVVVEE